MKIKIKHENINNYIVEDENNKNIECMYQELINRNSTSFLISGYKGAGKTTLIEKLEERFNNKDNTQDVIFIYLNLTKYQENNLMLRKLIRGIYLGLSSSEVVWNKLKKNDIDLIEQITNLYERTFYEVHTNQSYKRLEEKSVEFDLKTFNNIYTKYHGLIISIIFTVFHLGKIININKSLSEIVKLFTLLFWILIELFNIKSKRSNISIEEKNIKSLYDDEIAEYHLINVLDKLNRSKIKIVFVFDELDKIENLNETEKLVSNLKLLMHSSLASFIIVSGQKLYYKLIKSDIEDDPVLHGIFNKNIHVRLASKETLEKLFENYIDNLEYLNYQIVKFYRDSLILNSNRNLRKFKNLLLQDSIWENYTAYIIIKEEKKAIYERDSKILEIICLMEKNEINSEYDAGIKDFLTYQLFIWVKKMKLKDSDGFYRREVFDYSEDYSEIYPHWLETQLILLFNKFIDNMEKYGLIEMESRASGEYYKWINFVDYINEDTKINNIIQKKLQSEYLLNAYNLKQYCEKIYSGIVDKNIKNLDITEIVNKLYEIGIIEDKLKEKIKSIFEFKNEIENKIILNQEKIDFILKHQNDIRLIWSYLVEKFYIYASKTYLNQLNYVYQENGKIVDLYYSFDLIAKSNDLPDLFFEIKRLSNFNSAFLTSIFSKVSIFNDYFKKADKQIKLVIYIVIMNDSIDLTKIKFIEKEIMEYIKAKHNEIKQNINIYFDSSFNSNKISKFLSEVIYKQLSDVNLEIAVTSNDE